MEEKSLEEVMSDLSVSSVQTGPDAEEIKVAHENFIIDPISAIGQSPVEEQKLTLEGWAHQKNVRLLDTKYYEDKNLYTYKEYLDIVPCNMEVSAIVSNEDVKQEVADMVEEQHSDFYNQHIEEDMSSLEKQYVNMERSAAIIDAKIIKFKQDNAEIFNKLAELEKQKEDALANKDDYREVIARKLAIIGEKKWKGMEVEFTYYAPSFKESFNKKRFEKEQPNMYAKYLDKTPVKEYIKQKLSLLPILPEDLKEDK